MEKKRGGGFSEQDIRSSAEDRLYFEPLLASFIKFMQAYQAEEETDERKIIFLSISLICIC